jgi:hypothetical protein
MRKYSHMVISEAADAASIGLDGFDARAEALGNGVGNWAHALRLACCWRPSQDAPHPRRNGVTAIPRSFDTVHRVDFSQNQLGFVAASGRSVRQLLDLASFDR